MSDINLNTISEEDKIDLIFNIGELQQLNRDWILIINELSQDESILVRSTLAQVLVNFDCKEIEGILLKMLKDKDELVRAEACDSLCNSTSKIIVEELKTILLQDRSGIVRSYAALSIADIILNIQYVSEEIVQFFEEMIKKERIILAKIAYYRALYMFGKKEYLNKLFIQLNGKNYRNRCAVINAFTDILNEENQQIIFSKIIKRRARENSFAVTSKIDKLLEENESVK